MSDKAEAIEFGDERYLMAPVNIATRLENSLKSNYGKEAIVGFDTTVDYERLDALTKWFAYHIAERTDLHELVPVLSRGGADYCVAILACIRAGRPFVPVDVQWPRDRLTSAVNRLDPALLVVAGDISTLDVGMSLPSQIESVMALPLSLTCLPWLRMLRY